MASKSHCERLVAEAFSSWLLAQGSDPEYLSLQQLFSLCHAGVVPRQPAVPALEVRAPPFPPSTPTAPPPPVLGGALVRLLDGCLAAAASLPAAAQRRAAATTVLAAYCRSALREAALRGRATATAAAAGPTNVRRCDSKANNMDGGSGAAGAHAAARSTAAAVPHMDVAFLDAAFALLAAVADRHPGLAAELSLRELAAGAAAVPPPLPPAAPLLRTDQNGLGGRDGDGQPLEQVAGALRACDSDSLLQDAGAAEASNGQTADVTTAQQLADFFLSAEFQCKLAAGQLLYGMPYGQVAGGGGSASSGYSGRSGSGGGRGARPPRGDGAMDWHAGGAARGGRAAEEVMEHASEAEAEAHAVRALCEVPALAELCAAAAAAEVWPALLGCLAEGGPAALAAWLGCPHPELHHLADGFGAGFGEEARSRLGHTLCGAAAWAGGGRGGGEGGAGAAQQAVCAACCVTLAAALAAQPGAVLAAVPAPLLLLLATKGPRFAETQTGRCGRRDTVGNASDSALLAPLLRGIAAVLAPPAPPSPSPHLGRDEHAWADEPGDAPWRQRRIVGRQQHSTDGGEGGGGAQRRCDGAAASCVRRLHACFAAVGLDLGAMLQRQLMEG